MLLDVPQEPLQKGSGCCIYESVEQVTDEKGPFSQRLSSENQKRNGPIPADDAPLAAEPIYKHFVFVLSREMLLVSFLGITPDCLRPFSRGDQIKQEQFDRYAKPKGNSELALTLELYCIRFPNSSAALKICCAS